MAEVPISDKNDSLSSSTAPPKAPMITRSGVLKGHTDSVNTVSYHDKKNILVSGSDDGTARIWDLTTSKAIKCLLPPSTTAVREAISSIAFDNGNEDRIFVSAANKVFAFDLRRPDIILRETTATFDVNSDDINQICVDKKGRFLAASDDSGQIKIIELEAQRAYRTLRKHTSVCYSCKFLPNSQYEILTGGFDCNVIHFDFSKTTPICVYNIFDPSTGGPQIVNPPYVYGVDVTSDGQYACAALGDGSIAFLHLGLQDLVGRTEMAHGSAVSQTQFPAFAPDKYLLSSGWDQKFILWEYQLPTQAQVKAYADDQKRIQSEMAKRNAKSKGRGKKAPSSSSSSTAAPEPAVAAPSTHFKMEKKAMLMHHSKINGLTTAADGRVWIADVSSEISQIKIDV